MFDKFTANATNAAQTFSTRLTTAADKVAGVVTTVITTRVDDASKKVRNVEFDLTKFDVSKIDLPKIEFPRIDLEKFDLPTVDVGPELAKVADLARDVAYAGLGAAVVAVHQVDARVRRIAARAA